jgi:hypothetical protein
LWISVALLHRWSRWQPGTIQAVISTVAHRSRLRPGISDHALGLRCLLVERPGSKRRLALREESLVVQATAASDRRRDVALQTSLAFTRRRDGKTARHQAGLTELICADAALESGCAATAEFIAANG